MGCKMQAWIVCVAVLILLSACGFKGDLVRPANIPAYEKELKERNGSLPL